MKGVFMLRCLTEVIVTQLPKASDGTPRNLTMKFGFVNKFESSDTWTSLTNTAKVVLPKSMFVRNATGDLIPLGGTQASVLINTLFQRGDKIQIKYGYYTYDESGNETKELSQAFDGYISKVSSKKPIELECEDNMWLLKQIPCKPQTWPKNKTVEALCKELLKGTNFTVEATTETTIGDLIIQNESVAQLLARLRKDYHLEASFKGNQLRVGSQVYLDSDTTGKDTYVFGFQRNIISDKLEFQRRDDVKLSAICNSMNTVHGKVNKKGIQKTSQKKLSILIFWDALANNKAGEFKFVEKLKDIELPANEEGERRTLWFPDVSDPKKLFELGKLELQKFFYTGFKGDFTTFGIPFVQQGDDVALQDSVLPDRNGKYKVKGVTREGGVGGQRQTITLHYKLID